MKQEREGVEEKINEARKGMGNSKKGEGLKHVNN